MAMFPEDSAVQASQIIKLWIDEGFRYPIRDKSLEEAARIHLNALVDRNLIFASGKGKSGRAKSFGIHDLLRDLCLRKAREKRFLHFDVLKADNLQQDALFLGCIVSFDADEFLPILSPLTGSVRSYGNTYTTTLSCSCFKLPLLRVLDLRILPALDEFPGVILQLVNLKYLLIRLLDDKPVSFSGPRNLQTLVTSNIISLAIISDMPQLRLLIFEQMAEYSELPYGLHENLQSLSKPPAKEVRKLLGKLPNLRKLYISFDNDDEFINLTCFHNLKSLYCSRRFSCNMTFPVSLKKMSLESYEIGQSLLDAIGSLPRLQILKIHDCRDEIDWEPSEGGFCELKYLEMKNWNLVNWLATEVHFPVLEHLVLKDCRFLTEIPNDFGATETLKTIEVDECLPSVLNSARRIYEEQCKFGNTLLQLRFGRDPVEVEEENKMWEKYFKWEIFGISYVHHFKIPFFVRKCMFGNTLLQLRLFRDLVQVKGRKEERESTKEEEEAVCIRGALAAAERSYMWYIYVED